MSVSGPASQCGEQLVQMFFICSNWRMERIDPSLIAQAILAAPGWARVGITASTVYLREDAAAELARSILDHIQAEPEPSSEKQIGLAL